MSEVVSFEGAHAILTNNFSAKFAVRRIRNLPAHESSMSYDTTAFIAIRFYTTHSSPFTFRIESINAGSSSHGLQSKEVDAPRERYQSKTATASPRAAAAAARGAIALNSFHMCFRRLAPASSKSDNALTLRRTKMPTMDTNEDGSFRPAFRRAFLTSWSKTKMPPDPISICSREGITKQTGSGHSGLEKKTCAVRGRMSTKKGRSKLWMRTVTGTTGTKRLRDDTENEENRQEYLDLYWHALYRS